MKLSFTTMATPELNIDEAFSVAKQYGFHGLDLRMVERGKGEIDENLTDAYAAGILQKLDSLEFPSLLCYNKKLPDGQEVMVESILKHIRIAERLHIPMIRIFTGKPQDDDLEPLQEVLTEVLKRDPGNVILGMQNHINHCVSPAQALAVCEKMNSERIRLIFSPEQALMRGQEYASILPELAPHTAQLYVADIDQNHKHVFPGQGIMDHRSILRTLTANGFDGFVTFKWERCWYPELAAYSESFPAFMRWANDL